MADRLRAPRRGRRGRAGRLPPSTWPRTL